MSHTDAVSFLRSAPKTVRLVLGRVLELPKIPVLPHMLPDISLTCHKEELGNPKFHYSQLLLANQETLEFGCIHLLKLDFDQTPCLQAS